MEAARGPDLIDGAVRLWRCGAVRVEIEEREPPASTPEVDARWAAVREANPRHFDGTILGVEAFDPDGGVIRARAESYRRLVVQPDVGTGVTLLAVNGAVTALDGAGVEHALLVRRAAQTRLYGGLWELGPAGGLEPGGKSVVGVDGLVACLADELAEEAGLEAEFAEAAPVAVYEDRGAFSLDVLVRARLGETVERLRERAGELHWDSSEARWVAVGEVGRFARQRGCIPPMGVVLEALGWSADSE